MRWLASVPRGWWRLALLAALAFTLVMALTPITNMPLRFPHSDKVTHAFTFAVLTLIARLGWPASWRGAALGMLAFGALIEVLQSFTPTRAASVADVFADLLGVGLGLWLASRLIKQATTP